MVQRPNEEQVLRGLETLDISETVAAVWANLDKILGIGAFVFVCALLICWWILFRMDLGPDRFERRRR